MSKLLDLLPPYWRDYELMRGFAAAVGRPLDEWRGIVGQLYRYVDPWGAPASWLDALMDVVGLPRNDGLTDLQKRALISSAFTSWIRKGTPIGIEGYLRAVTSSDAEVVRTNHSAFVTGFHHAADICGPGVEAWNFKVRVSSSTGYSEPQVRSLLEPVSSSLESFVVEFF